MLNWFGSQLLLKFKVLLVCFFKIETLWGRTDAKALIKKKKRKKQETMAKPMHNWR